MRTCISPIAIPELDCDPAFSILRMRDYLPVNIDTTKVVNSFDFTEDDVNTSWEYEVVVLGSTTTTDEPAKGECEVGGNLVTQEGELKYISYLAGAISAADGRGWISPVSCEDFTGGVVDASISAGKRGVVHFANPRTRNLSLPTFIPRSGGSAAQPTLDTCGINSISILVTPESDNIELFAGEYVNYYYTEDKENPVCRPCDNNKMPWGVIISEKNEEIDTWCCLISGVYDSTNSPDTELFIGDRYSPVSATGVAPDPQGAAKYLGYHPKTDEEGTYEVHKWLLSSDPTTQHHFKVVNYPTDGLAVCVTCHSDYIPESGTEICGVLNGVAYRRTILNLSKNTEYYIYAVDGSIYALTHEFYSDLFPVLLIATVTTEEDSLSIIQYSTIDNPTVPVKSGTLGTTTLNYSKVTGTPTDKLSYTYTINGSVTRNSLPIYIPDNTALSKQTAEKYKQLVVYLKKLTVTPNTEPETGFEIIDSGEAVSGNPEWSQCILEYQYTDNGFRIKYRIENPYIFSFARLHLNAEDVTV